MITVNLSDINAASHLDKLIHLALSEDIGGGDVTTLACVPYDLAGSAVVIAKQELVLAGSSAGKRVYELLYHDSHSDNGVEIDFKGEDGTLFTPKSIIAELTGPLALILSGERTFLNFVGRLSGIATFTRECAKELEGAKTKLLDTRKTTPGLRMLEKSAVHAGGGENHRMGLYDAFLIKENHIASAGGITQALDRAFLFAKKANRKLTVEIEVRDKKEFEEAIAHDPKPDIIMLDNFDKKSIPPVVALRDKISLSTKLEVSGNLGKGKLKELAGMGIDYLSMGALTHSAPSADISMLIKGTHKS